jgi:hypothetical protein
MSALTHRYWPGRATVGSLIVGILGFLLMTGCRVGVPVVDPGPRPMEAAGTISGTVRGPEGTGAFEGRLVEVVNVETDERQRATTNNAGGFTFKVKPGKYRVQLTLREGEAIIKQPDLMDVNPSDVDAHADFVIGTVRISRPRTPAHPTDAALGAPIA